MNPKKQKFYVWGLLIAMIATYGFFPIAPNVNAVGTITDASDTLSDSDVNYPSTHTFQFTTASSTLAGGVIDVIFPFPITFGSVSGTDFNCPAGTWASSTPNTYTLRCTNTSGSAVAPGAMTIVTGLIMNPNAESTQYITIANDETAGGVRRERVKVAVVIIQDVKVTATVDSNLEFTVVGTTTPLLGVYDCADTNLQTPTATSVPFGTLPLTPVNLCQALRVTTNAQDGYIVTVEQDHELLSDSGANINSFDNAATGLGTTSPKVWAAPLNILDDRKTYGHLAIATNDDQLIGGSGLSDFYTTEQLFAGLSSSNIMTVMDHDGPSDGLTQDKGLATVMYRAQIASLQEAGDYSSTLTYICTPTF